MGRWTSSRRRANRFASAVAVIFAVLATGLLGCSSSSPTRELQRDTSRDTVAGPRPTAPPSTAYGGSGLSEKAVEVLNQLREFQQERDLCGILTSETVKDILAGDVEVAGLVTTPSGIAQVLVALDSFFAHLVEISPPAVRPAMAQVQNTWKEISAIPPDALDREQRTDAILSAPELDAAVDSIGRWMAQNCVGQPAQPFDLSALAGGLGQSG